MGGALGPSQSFAYREGKKDINNWQSKAYLFPENVQVSGLPAHMIHDIVTFAHLTPPSNEEFLGQLRLDG